MVRQGNTALQCKIKDAIFPSWSDIRDELISYYDQVLRRKINGKEPLSLTKGSEHDFEWLESNLNYDKIVDKYFSLPSNLRIIQPSTIPPDATKRGFTTQSMAQRFIADYSQFTVKQYVSLDGKWHEMPQGMNYFDWVFEYHDMLDDLKKNHGDAYVTIVDYHI